MKIQNIPGESGSSEPPSVGKRFADVVKSGGRKFAREVGKMPKALEKKIAEIFSRVKSGSGSLSKSVFSVSKGEVLAPEGAFCRLISWQEADHLRDSVDNEFFTTPQLTFKLHTIISDAESTVSADTNNLNAKEIVALLIDDPVCYHNLLLFSEKHGDIPNVLMQDGDHSVFMNALKNLDKYANNEDGWNSVPFH